MKNCYSFKINLSNTNNFVLFLKQIMCNFVFLQKNQKLKKYLCIFKPLMVSSLQKLLFSQKKTFDR